MEPSPTIPQKEKLDFIDLLKALASFTVVLYHYNYIDIDILNKGGVHQYFNYYVTAFLPIAVPIFFLANGALLLNKRSIDIRHHGSKIIQFIILVIVWGVITYTILSFLHHEKIIFYDLVKSIYYLKQGWTNHLWFLQALVVVYIFFPLLYTAFNHAPSHLHFFLAIAAVLTLGNTLLMNAATVVGYIFDRFNGRDLHINYFSGFNAFQGIYGYSFAYFILGGLLVRYKTYLQSRALRVIALVTIPLATGLQFLYAIIVSKKEHEVWDVVWHGHDTICTLLIVLGLYIVFMPYKHKGVLGKIIKTAGQNTFGIYFLHVIVAEAISFMLFKNTTLTDYFTNSFFALIIMGTSLLIALGLRQIPVLKYLVSLRS